MLGWLKPIDRKIIRDLWKMRTQVLAIALVIGCGVSVYIISLSTLDSLIQTQSNYYREYRFADLFVSLKQAPNALLSELRSMDGIQAVESRVVAAVNIEVKDFSEPINGRIVSLPENHPPTINRLYVREGRLLEPTKKNEVLVSDGFAKAHALKPGHQIVAVINGHWETLTIAGIVLSPEYIYQIAPGALFPDFAHYAILWMNEAELSVAYDMEDSFNDLTMTLMPHANTQQIKKAVDNILKSYGGQGSYQRKDHLSHRFLSEELKQLRAMAVLFPVIFFSVAGFLIYIFTTRMINVQRNQIAILKAFGYTNTAIQMHYFKMVLVLVILGFSIGLVAGAWLGQALSNLYADFYHFPYLNYILSVRVFLSAAFLACVFTFLGAWTSIGAVVSLSPAEAMTMPPPKTYQKSMLEVVSELFYQGKLFKIVIRNIARRPIKTLTSLLGVAFACGIVMIGNFQEDALNTMLDIQFRVKSKEDLQLSFKEPLASGALYSLKELPGVRYTEGQRQVAVKLKFENREYLTALQGFQQPSHLSTLLDIHMNPRPLPERGIILTRYLADLLHISVGDNIFVEPLEKNRPILELPVVGTCEEYVGVGGYLTLDALNTIMQEGHVISSALLTINKGQQQEIFNELKGIPKVSAINVKTQAWESFQNTLGDTLLIFTLIINIFGGLLAFGVIYNNIRIILQERYVEFSTLRILGFSVAEVTYLIVAEVVLLTLVAIPMGLVFGYFLCHVMARNLQSDLYRVPLVLKPHTFASAGLLVVICSVISFVIVWRNIKQLDFIGALKTKE